MQDGLVMTWVVEWELAVVCVCFSTSGYNSSLPFA